jgi:hypothetical protein
MVWILPIAGRTLWPEKAGVDEWRIDVPRSSGITTTTWIVRSDSVPMDRKTHGSFTAGRLSRAGRGTHLEEHPRLMQAGYLGVACAVHTGPA